MLDDDLFDLDSVEGMVLVAGSGVLDDEAQCECACGCDRTATWPDDLCQQCQAGDHEPADPFGSGPDRPAFESTGPEHPGFSAVDPRALPDPRALAPPRATPPPRASAPPRATPRPRGRGDPGSR